MRIIIFFTYEWILLKNMKNNDEIVLSRDHKSIPFIHWIYGASPIWWALKFWKVHGLTVLFQMVNDDYNKIENKWNGLDLELSNSWTRVQTEIKLNQIADRMSWMW